MLLALTLALSAAGCSEVGDDRPAELTTLEAGGTVMLALGKPFETVDPLLASGRAERLASRQVHEPLVSREQGPFGNARERTGLVRTIKSQAGGRTWSLRLRRGVRFQNGLPLDAEAVVENASRWISTGLAADLLPGLQTAFSPRPGRVQLGFDRPIPSLPRRLGDGRLGIVVPTAIPNQPGRAIRGSGTGTGPFELRERSRTRLLFTANPDWWGTPFELGPGVERLELLTFPGPELRVEQLRAGAVQVADELTPAAARELLDEPLLTLIEGAATAIGFERSVRGIDSTRADQSLADLWLTTLR